MYMYLFAVVLLGIVVFVHELGHFIFARLFNVRVLAFSLGFGKVMVKWKRGDTEYRISAIPLGGYVKMLGESPEDEKVLENNEYPYSYSHKKWWQKVIIAFAGPFFNIVLAFFVFMTVSFYEYSAPAPVIEFLEPTGAAAIAGMSEGDKITEINGQPVYVWEDIQLSMSKIGKNENVCEKTEITVQKVFSGEIKKYTVIPKKGEYKDLFNENIERCELGIARLPKDAAIALTNKLDNLQTGDKIDSVDGRPVSRFYELKELTSKPFSRLSVTRNGQKLEFTLPGYEWMLFSSSVVHGGLVISKVEKDSISESVGIKEGDIITSLNGKTISVPYQFISTLQEMKQGDAVEIRLVRNNVPQTVNFKVDIEEKENQFTGMKDRTVKWGAQFAFNYDAPEVFAKRANPALFSLKYSVEQTVNIIGTTFKGFWYLITGKMSSKSLGGPIMIFDISKKAAEAGFKHFLYILAVISINLGIINLFPVPVLDGGYIVMYTLEGVFKKTIPVSVKEKMLMVGMALLLLLMVYAIFNDVTRYFSMFLGG